LPQLKSPGTLYRLVKPKPVALLRLGVFKVRKKLKEGKEK